MIVCRKVSQQQSTVRQHSAPHWPSQRHLVNLSSVILLDIVQKTFFFSFSALGGSNCLVCDNIMILFSLKDVTFVCKQNTSSLQCVKLCGCQQDAVHACPTIRPSAAPPTTTATMGVKITTMTLSTTVSTSPTLSSLIISTAISTMATNTTNAMVVGSTTTPVSSIDETKTSNVLTIASSTTIVQSGNGKFVYFCFFHLSASCQTKPSADESLSISDNFLFIPWLVGGSAVFCFILVGVMVLTYCCLIRKKCNYIFYIRIFPLITFYSKSFNRCWQQ